MVRARRGGQGTARRPLRHETRHGAAATIAVRSRGRGARLAARSRGALGVEGRHGARAGRSPGGGVHLRDAYEHVDEARPWYRAICVDGGVAGSISVKPVAPAEDWRRTFRARTRAAVW